MVGARDGVLVVGVVVGSWWLQENVVEVGAVVAEMGEASVFAAEVPRRRQTSRTLLLMLLCRRSKI